MEQKRSILSIEAVPQTRLRYARGRGLKEKRFQITNYGQERVLKLLSDSCALQFVGDLSRMKGA